MTTVRTQLLLTVRRVALLALLTPFTGCASVPEPMNAKNAPGGEPPVLKGMPASQQEYFDAKYPPGKWPPVAKQSTLSVGPVLISREALTLLAGDDASRVVARAESATERVTVAAESRSGQTRYFVAENYSFEAQAVLVEELAKSRRFTLSLVDRDALRELRDGPQLLTALRGKGIAYYLEGSLIPGTKDGGYTLYLRVVDTARGTVLSAVSGSGATLGEVVRTTTRLLAATLAPT